MSHVKIDFSEYPHDAIDKRGTVGAPFGEWLEAVDSLQASDHELRANFNKKEGSLQVYFNIEKSKRQNNAASIYSSNRGSLRVVPDDRQLIVDFIMERLRKSRKLNVLTWNIGTGAELIHNIKSTVLQLSVNLSYPERPHFYDVVTPNQETYYDIICLQEVPTQEHSLKKGGNCVWVETFNSDPWTLGYKCYVSLRGNNALITLVKRDLYGNSASLSRTDLAFEKEPDPKSLTPVDRHIYYPFAQKIPVLGINAFNVHLNATSAYVRKKQLWELITHCDKTHNIIAGDLNTEWGSLPSTFKAQFSTTPCAATSFTYENPCDASAGKRHECVYDYIGLWRSPKLKPINRKLTAHPWGFGKAHRHFPVEAVIAF